MEHFLGDSAGPYNTIGEYNTYLGYQAGGSSGFATVNNTTCLGYQSGVLASPITSNAIYLGNSSTSAIYSEVSPFTYSDQRIKDSIKENVPGLAFINKLRPVTYNLNIHKQNQLLGTTSTVNWDGKYDIEKTKQSGFIAQQVDSAAKACGYNFNGVNKPLNNNGLYSLSYSDFVVPLVKAVQELSKQNDSLRNALQNIQRCINQICQRSNQNISDSTQQSLSSFENVTLGVSNAPILYQNAPNPFSTGTKINYYLPQGTIDASITFFDSYGNPIKTVKLTQCGNGMIDVTPDNLANGIYSYSLTIGGNLIDTKRMIIQK